MELNQLNKKLARLNGMMVCPICHNPLEMISHEVRCTSNHSFNVSKSGSINFIPVKIHARDRAYYANELALHQLPPFRELLESVTDQTTEPFCLTGSSLSPFLGSSGIGFEAAQPSVDLQLKENPDRLIFTALADRLPLPTGSMDRVIRLDDQSGIEESLRILASGHRMFRIIPGPGHLLELRRHLFTGRRLGLREKPALIRELYQLQEEGGMVRAQRFRKSFQPTVPQKEILLRQWISPNDLRIAQIAAVIDAVTFDFMIYSLQKHQ